MVKSNGGVEVQIRSVLYIYIFPSRALLPLGGSCLLKRLFEVTIASFLVLFGAPGRCRDGASFAPDVARDGVVWPPGSANEKFGWAATPIVLAAVTLVAVHLDHK